MRLDFNENTAGCSPRVLEKLRSLDYETLNRYPERDSVEAVVAGYMGLDAAEILLTNGVDEGIHLLCEAYIEPGDQALIAVPTFSMYEIYALAADAKVVTVQAGKDFAFPTEELISKIEPRTRLIAIATPNNPTGAVVEEATLLRIAAAAPQAAVLVDEAYFDFYGKTIMPRVREVPNLFVARTFSKAYGLAGLRCGILAGDREQMRMVRRVSSPYNVNAIALAALPEALADREYIANYVTQVRRGRARLQAELNEFGIEYWPQPGEFRADEAWRQAAGVCRRDEGARHPGARPQQRSRLRRLRAHHRGHG